MRRIIRILKVNLPGHLKDKKFLAQRERKYSLTFNYVLGVNDDNRAKIYVSFILPWKFKLFLHMIIVSVSKYKLKINVIIIIRVRTQVKLENP